MSSKYGNIVFNNVTSCLLRDKVDLFIACIGYEDRSFYIFEKYIQNVNKDNILLFAIDDYKNTNAERIINKAYTDKIEIHIVKYDEYETVLKIIENRIKRTIDENKSARIHVDYSSMPRRWYCEIPPKAAKCLTPEAEVYFWYSEGKYKPFKKGNFPTVVATTPVSFSGKPSLIEKQRTLFVGVGFDDIKTRWVIDRVNASCIIACWASNPSRYNITKKIEEINKGIFDEILMNIQLDITNIDYMISKIYGIVNEEFSGKQSEIVIIPDGPKPLILVLSMIPWLMQLNNKEQGVSCLLLSKALGTKSKNIVAMGSRTSLPEDKKDYIIGFSMGLDQNCDSIQ